MLKREAHRAQALGEQLIALKDSELMALELPEALYDAIVAARSISSRGGGTRQRQYIGKLMRDIDLTRVRETLGAKAAQAALEAQRFQRAENWRVRLLEAGPARPGGAVHGVSGPGPRRSGSSESARPGPNGHGPAPRGRRARELFRALRELLDRPFGPARLQWPIAAGRAQPSGVGTVSVWVGIIMGSASDWETMRPAAEVLEALGVPHEVRVVSAHRTPDLLFEYATSARARGLEAIIAGAGGAAHLPGMTAAKTSLPVLGVPVQSKALNGMDSLLSIVQMPAGIPVATFAIGTAGATNAALLAAAIIANRHPEVLPRLEEFRDDRPPGYSSTPTRASAAP